MMDKDQLETQIDDVVQRAMSELKESISSLGETVKRVASQSKRITKLPPAVASVIARGCKPDNCKCACHVGAFDDVECNCVVKDVGQKLKDGVALSEKLRREERKALKPTPNKGLQDIKPGTPAYARLTTRVSMILRNTFIPPEDIQGTTQSIVNTILVSLMAELRKE
jgi:hypothetical protein